MNGREWRAADAPWRAHLARTSPSYSLTTRALTKPLALFTLSTLSALSTLSNLSSVERGFVDPFRPQISRRDDWSDLCVYLPPESGGTSPEHHVLPNGWSRVLKLSEVLLHDVHTASTH